MTPGLVLSRVMPWLLAVLLVGCIQRGTRVTEAEQQSFGTRTFAAAYDATFAAARDALPALGYELNYVSAAQGRITSTRRPSGARAEIGFGGPSATPLYRQYDLRLIRLDPAHTRVIAIPYMYAGDRDISRERVWNMSGHQGEYAQWQQLFTQIQNNL